MKILAIIAVVAFASVITGAAVFTKRNEEELTRFRNECAVENKVPKEILDKYDKLEYPDDELTHKSIKCAAQKYGTWNEKDGFVPEYMLIQFGQNKKDILAKCLTKRDPKWTTEKWVWNDWNCLAANGILKP